MPKFTYLHNTYEFPEDVNVIVRQIPHFRDNEIFDFDFHKDGKVIPYVDWGKNGITHAEDIKYEDLS